MDGARGAALFASYQWSRAIHPENTKAKAKDKGSLLPPAGAKLRTAVTFLTTESNGVSAASVLCQEGGS